eukprot:Tamp_13367.p1 GENE.Tamp_13367~~Tamp_13367.p1  ORF type:complete len:347 (+),score=28.39 Tamp_13367:495-1535(+)
MHGRGAQGWTPPHKNVDNLEGADREVLDRLVTQTLQRDFANVQAHHKSVQEMDARLRHLYAGLALPIQPSAKDTKPQQIPKMSKQVPGEVPGHGQVRLALGEAPNRWGTHMLQQDMHMLADAYKGIMSPQLQPHTSGQLPNNNRIQAQTNGYVNPFRSANAASSYVGMDRNMMQARVAPAMHRPGEELSGTAGPVRGPPAWTAPGAGSQGMGGAKPFWGMGGSPPPMMNMQGLIGGSPPPMTAHSGRGSPTMLMNGSPPPLMAHSGRLSPTMHAIPARGTSPPPMVPMMPIGAGGGFGSTNVNGFAGMVSASLYGSTPGGTWVGAMPMAPPLNFLGTMGQGGPWSG